MRGMDRDTRVLIQKIVCKYDVYKKEIEEMRNAILSRSTLEYSEIDMPKGGLRSDKTAQAALQLDRLENTWKAKAVRAVDHAKREIPPDMADAVLKSCKDGRRYPFERFSGLNCSRAQFYRIRRAFLDELRYALGL